MKKIDVIIPDIWKNKADILAFFTMKNADHFSDNRAIKGLNLGLNTEEASSIVLNNRKILFDAHNLDTNKVVLVHQIHGNRVVFVENPDIDEKADALVTGKSGIALGIQVADCAAVLLADRKNRIIGAAHAGWRGAVAGVVEKTVKKMIEAGAQVNHIEAYISPCICQKKFEVGEEVAMKFDDAFVDREHYDKPHVDLKAYLNHQLINLKVKESAVQIDPGCTISDENKFYSFRREKNKSGRMLALICLK